MNLKWFSKNIKAVFAEEEGWGKGHPETTASRVKKEIPVLITYFPWLAHSGLGSGNGSGDVSIKKDL